MFENTKNQFFYRHQEIIVSTAVIVLCLILVTTFPSYDIFQKLTKGLFFFLIVPALYIRLALRKNLSDFGLNLENRKVGITWGILMFFASLAIAYAFIKITPFVSNYDIPINIRNSFWIFTLTMLILYNFILFFQEFFFRGFILSVFRPKIHFWSPVIQVVFYWGTILIASIGMQKEFWQTIPFAILSITGGITAYKSRSIIYSWAGGLLFLIVLNSYLIYIVKTK